MRIISGFLKSRIIKGYDIVGTRPTMDKVKESVFGIIQNDINKSICLDLFAGSGSLGIEAISNGASKTYFVDNNLIAINTLKDNISLLKIEEYSVLLYKDYLNSLKYFKEFGIKFDIIFLDPPYNDIFIENVIKDILKNDILNNNAIIICEYENEVLKDDYENLFLIKYKDYGNKKVKIYRNKSIC